MKSKLRVGLTMRIEEPIEYSDPRDAISQDWINLILKLNFIPFLIPSNKSIDEPYLSDLKLDAFILTNGGESNISKGGKYNKRMSSRDFTELNILRYGLKKNIPIMGVCRGMQFIYKFYGGKLKKIKNKSHVAKEHLIKFVNGKNRSVCSFHDFSCVEDSKPKELSIVAYSEDGEIEAIKHTSKKIYGIQWHPERIHSSQKEDLKMIESFFN